MIISNRMTCKETNVIDISIIIITFNYANYITDCILSCINQKNNNIKYEIIVVDDGSTDNTQEVLKKINSNKLTIIKIENSGIEKAANTGFEIATGKYVVRVDADDLLLPNYLSVMSGYLNNQYAFIYSNYHLIDASGKIIRKVYLPTFNKSEIFARGDFLATGTLFNSEVIKENQYYNLTYKNCGIENFELVLRLISKGHLGFRVPLSLFAYRRHSASVSQKKRRQIIETGKEMFISNNYGEFRTNIYHPYDLRI